MSTVVQGTSVKADEFRATLRAHATSQSKDVKNVLLVLLDDVSVGAENRTDSSNRLVSKDLFTQKINTIRSVRQRFTPNDMNDIYNEAVLELGHANMTVIRILEYFSRTISRARSMAMKLRAAVAQDFDGELEYRRAFSSMSNGSNPVLEVDALGDFCEDMLDLEEGSLSDKDAKDLYAIVDKNCDGKVTVDDFVEFVVGQSAEAARHLNVGNNEVLVDIKTSNRPEQELELKKAGYAQVIPDLTGIAGADISVHGSFGNGASLWIWKCKQGTCNGRLKPIVNVQLNKQRVSTDMVLLGYTCLPVPISGQYLWIKRALTLEEENDAIVDFRVSLGTSKVASDKIWQSPGVGWMHVEGNFKIDLNNMLGLQSQDAFLWFRPLRNRSRSSQAKSISMGGMAGNSSLSDGTRQARLLKATRLAIRHYVPTNYISSLAISSEDAGVSGTDRAIKPQSDAKFDFTNLFVMYCGNADYMALSSFRKVLVEVGICMDKVDETKCFKYIDNNHDNQVDRRDFARFNIYSDYEMDCIIDNLRSRLLSRRAGKKMNPLRQSRVLSHIFRHVNLNGDKVMCQNEFMAMCSKLEIFLVGEEAHYIMELMDLDGDGRIEEGDFVRFLQQPSEAFMRKAQRVHDSSMVLRRWLRRGSSSSANAHSAPCASQWLELKKRCEHVNNKAFPGYLSPQDLLLILAQQGKNLTYLEASELALVIAPHKPSRIQELDLVAFMNMNSRSIGELAALVERDVMKDVIDVYRAHRAALNLDGTPDESLADRYSQAVDSIVSRIISSQASNPEEAASIGKAGGSSKNNSRSKISTSMSSSSNEIASVSQLKSGIEACMGHAPMHGACPNYEEWALLAVLVEAACPDDDVDGVFAARFVEGICEYVAGKLGVLRANENLSLDVLLRNLRGMIKDEAAEAAGGRGHDYATVFSSFDLDGGGDIDLVEFRAMLNKFQLVDRLPESQVPELLRSFDRRRTGRVKFDDFLAFVESGDADEDGDEALDDDDDNGDLVLGIDSNRPPASVTRNADCDWLVWFLWRQACRHSYRDPEAAVLELEASCKNVAVINAGGDVTIDDAGLGANAVWRVLGDLKLLGNMTRSQFEAGVRFLALDGSGRDNDPLDYVSLCRYVVRMGRTYNGMVQERRNVDSKTFKHLFATLQKELIVIDSTKSGNVDMSLSSSTPSVSVGSQFERILRRQDTNQDGLLTVPEFKLGLRRLKVSDERHWTRAMIRKLFEECDNRSDGLLSISELGKKIRGDYGALGESKKDDLSDDEDDRIFSAQKRTTDASLQAKVSSVLMDLVPLSGQSASPGSIATHADAVKAAIYKFFQRFDPSSDGLVNEEQFLVFCRKSGLQNRLRGGELRRLTTKLRSRGPNSQVDYERLCRMISPNSDSVPRAKADALMMRLQEASHASGLANRSFLSLCSLADPRMVGKITNDELCIVSKMMGCPLDLVGLEMVKELQSDWSSSLAETRGLHSGSGMVDYRQMNHLILTYIPGAHASTTFEPHSESKDAHGTYRSYAHGALPSYATPGGVTRMPASPMTLGATSMDMSNMLRTSPSPAGLYLSTPSHAYDRMAASTPMSSYPAHGLNRSLQQLPSAAKTIVKVDTTHDRALRALLERVKESRLSRGGVPAIEAFQRRMEEMDTSGTGYLSEVALQRVFEDCEVALSAPDIFALRTCFRHSHADDRIDATALCAHLHTLYTQTASAPGAHGFAGVLQSPAISRKVRGLRSDGVDVRQLLAEGDVDGAGTCDSRRFSDVVMRLGLVQTERQLVLALKDYGCLTDRSRVNYLDFCDALGQAEGLRKSIDADGYDMGRSLDSSGRKGVVFGSGYDGLAASSTPGIGGGTHRSTNNSNANSLALEWGSELDSARSDNGNGLRGGGRPPMSVGRLSGERREEPAVSRGGATWSCHVCSHHKNPQHAPKCVVCDSAPPVDDGIGGSGGLKNVCRNCDFVNSDAAKTCNICELLM